jgi:hypothetical protein
MTGSGLAAILIPIAGTIFLATWLALVFYVGGHPRRAGGNPAPPSGPPVGDGSRRAEVGHAAGAGQLIDIGGDPLQDRCNPFRPR